MGRANDHGLAIRLGAFLARLAHDARGNTLIMVAAAMLPLICLVGSGIDMGRGYLAQTRLQEACDAAALAGRRAMSAGVVDSTVTAEATKFFKFNFPVGAAAVGATPATTAAFGAAPFTPVVAGAANSTVTVTAATTLPTSIMKMFGYANLPIQVTCYAKQDFVNTDILLVLDNTGSMNDDVNDNAVNGGPTSKIAGLRSAVMALYDQLSSVQTQLEAVGLRLRYGVVPYSSTVNVGAAIRSVNPIYLDDTSNYQTRVANYTTPVYAPSGTQTVTNETFSSAITAANCLSYGYNQAFSGYTPNPAGEPIAGNPTLTYYLPSTWNGSTSINALSTGTKTCVRTKTVWPKYSTRYAFTSFGYQQDSVDSSTYKTFNATTVADKDGNSVMSGTIATSGSYDGVYVAANASTTTFAIPTAVTNGVLPIPAPVAGTSTTVQTPLTTTSNTWRGCIEERQTVSTINSASGYTIPGGAYDLNIDYIPDSDATDWSPHWPEMIWYRKGGAYTSSTYANQQMTNDVNTPAISDPANGYFACPAAAVRLKAWSRGDLQTYVNSLQAIGGTYHDIGMIWGARFLSPDGIFGSDNPSVFGNMPVSRYIIFLTDGLMSPNPDSYTAYGVEYMDQRVTGTSAATNQKADHVQRLAMICNAAKAKGISIWVIGFAQALDSSLTNCASSAAQASTSGSQSDLIARFTEIGKNIGALRLTQ